MVRFSEDERFEPIFHRDPVPENQREAKESLVQEEAPAVDITNGNSSDRVEAIAAQVDMKAVKRKVTERKEAGNLTYFSR